MENFDLERLAIEERRRYGREWRAKNPDKVREQNRRYWLRRAQQRLSAQAQENGGGKLP